MQYGYLALVILGLLVLTITIAWIIIGNELRTTFVTAGNPRRRLAFLRNKMKPRESIPLVTMGGAGDYKYVVIIHANRIYVRGNRHGMYHADIVADFFFEVGSRKIHCLGGGRINIDPLNQTFKLYGTSMDYGTDPDRARTVALIQQNLPLQPR